MLSLVISDILLTLQKVVDFSLKFFFRMSITLKRHISKFLEIAKIYIFSLSIFADF
jgi:hypothetical protein